MKIVVLLVLLMASVVSAFVGSTSSSLSQHRRLPFVARRQSTHCQQQQHNMMPVDCSNILISTIDSDIANIPTNEFAPVFMGGVVVMLGGVLSALIVGFILERGNLYANVVADSYAQGGDNDEEFWEKLSDEEKKKARAMIDQLNAKAEAQQQQQQDDGGSQASPSLPRMESSAKVMESTDVVVKDEQETVVVEKSAQELDMFSDYADTRKS